MLSSSLLFTRQQVAELIGASDDVLSFWIRNDLIAPTKGGAGKGSHRKFDLFQVNIAAVLVELRKFGVNIGTMRTLAQMLQVGTALGRSAECNFFAIYNALNLFDSLEYFRAGNEVHVFLDPPPEERGRSRKTYRERVAMSEQDILDDTRADQLNLRDHYENIAALASRITPSTRLPLQLFFDLNQLAYRYVWDNNASEWGDAEWLIVPMDGGKLDIIVEGGQDGFLGKNQRKIRSGLFLLPAEIFRGVWGESLQPVLIYEPPPSPEELARRDRARQIRADRLRGREADIRNLLYGADE